MITFIQYYNFAVNDPFTLVPVCGDRGTIIVDGRLTTGRHINTALTQNRKEYGRNFDAFKIMKGITLSRNVSPASPMIFVSGIIYVRHGEPYRKLKRYETIKKGAMHSWCHGELVPILNQESVGVTPAFFSNQRDFYNPITIANN